MALADILSGLGDIQKGWVAGDKARLQNQELKTKMALQAIALQRDQQQQEGAGLSAKAIRGYDPGQIPLPPMAPLGGGPVMGMPQSAPMATRDQGPLRGGGMVSGLSGPGAVKGSWFGNSPGWQDPSDSGLQASGVPVAGNPGIALPSRSTLGQQFDVTAPSGQTMTLPQTDIGPAKWTGRGVDINAPAAEAMGYTPKNFPTDQQFIVKAHHQLDTEVGQKGVGLIQQGAPVPAIQASTGLAKQAGREIDPQQWGMAGLHQMMAAIDKADPGAPDAVKMIALGQLNKLIAPEERLQVQMYMKEHAQDLQVGLAEFKAAKAEERLKETLAAQAGRVAEVETKGGTVVQSGDQFFRIPPKGDPVPLNLPAGTHKMGTGQTGNVSDMQAEWVANYIQTTGTWPVGSGRNQALQNKVEQVLAAKGVDPKAIAQAQGGFKADSTSLAAATKLADATASYEQTALKNLDLATEQIHKAAPTDFGPTINKWIETGQTFAGDTTVPKSVAAVVTLANEYAKVMSGSTGAMAATDSSRREAAEILNPYFSSGQWDEVSSLIKQEMGNRITSLRDNVDIIQSRIGRGGATKPPAEKAGAAAGPASGYSTAASVWEAYQAGKLPREQAMKILEDQFGVKAQ